MDITLINKQKNLYNIHTVGKYIAEYHRDVSKRKLIHIYLYNPVDNTIFEVMPGHKKSDVIEIVNAVWNSNDIYFCSFSPISEEQIEISIYKYLISSDTELKICSFTVGKEVFTGAVRIKAFILNDTTILLQSENLHPNASENRLGSIEFNLALYNMEKDAATTIVEANFINNGINSIIPISDSRIMIKTGYSYLEDSRLDHANDSDALIESVYVTTCAKFIADLTIDKDSVDMQLLESTYMDKHITNPRVSGDYIYFSVIDAANNINKCIFYNHETDERMEYAIDITDFHDLNAALIIDEMPYVRQNSGTYVNFINLKKAEIDISFDEDIFIDQIGKIFIMQDMRRSGKIRIYSYPKLKLIFNEKVNFQHICCLNDNYYIYS